MVRFWCYFSPQNPVGKPPRAGAGDRVVGGQSQCRRCILARDIKTGVMPADDNRVEPGFSRASQLSAKQSRSPPLLTGGTINLLVLIAAAPFDPV